MRSIIDTTLTTRHDWLSPGTRAQVEGGEHLSEITSGDTQVIVDRPHWSFDHSTRAIADGPPPAYFLSLFIGDTHDTRQVSTSISAAHLTATES